MAASPPSTVDGLISRLRDHVVQELALHGVVIDDEDAFGHMIFGELPVWLSRFRATFSDWP